MIRSSSELGGGGRDAVGYNGLARGLIQAREGEAGTVHLNAPVGGANTPVAIVAHVVEEHLKYMGNAAGCVNIFESISLGIRP